MFPGLLYDGTEVGISLAMNRSAGGSGCSTHGSSHSRIAHRITGYCNGSEDRVRRINLNTARCSVKPAFLLENPELAIEMGNAARRRVEKLFSWEQCVDRYDVLYHN
jgi:glycosyltransferase involved in cell wall biosynthesis